MREAESMRTGSVTPVLTRTGVGAEVSSTGVLAFTAAGKVSEESRRLAASI
jgi:hypothetical protein